jgi:hypothetical protein
VFDHPAFKQRANAARRSEGHSKLTNESHGLCVCEEPRHRVARETPPGDEINEITKEVTTPEPSISEPWPAALPNLGERRVIAFSPCEDCETDQPVDDILKVGRYEVAVPGHRGTFVAFGDMPLCRRHATRRRETAR